MNKALTVLDVAELLSLSPITVYRLANKGQIPAVRVGRCWRFTREAIQNWLAGQAWEQRLEALLAKVWERTKKIPEDELDREIRQAISSVRKKPHRRS